MDASNEKLKSEGPELKNRVFGGRKGGLLAPVPDGRTKKAYAYQPQRAKWPCWKCDAVRDRLLREAANAKEREKVFGEVSFRNKRSLDSHIRVHHTA